MALIDRLLARWKDAQRERRIDAYASLAHRFSAKGNTHQMLRFAHLMRVEMNARSEAQLDRMRVKLLNAVAARREAEAKAAFKLRLADDRARHRQLLARG